MLQERNRPRSSRGRVVAGLTLILGLALFAACRSTEDFGDVDRELLVSMPPLPVTLSSQLRGLRKRSEHAGQTTVYKVGHLLRRLFTASDGRAFLSLVDSEIEVLGDPASAWRSTYSLTVALQHEGRVERIEARGAGESTVSPRDAGKLAIEQCVERLLQDVAPRIAAAREPLAR